MRSHCYHDEVQLKRKVRQKVGEIIQQAMQSTRVVTQLTRHRMKSGSKLSRYTDKV